MKGSTLTNDPRGGARNGGLSFAPWIATQSIDNFSRIQELQPTLNNVKSIEFLPKNEIEGSPYNKDYTTANKEKLKSLSKALRKGLTQALSPAEPVNKSLNLPKIN